jgi:bidirectional [NiFe] hydrogenase diaphorase subunit
MSPEELQDIANAEAAVESQYRHRIHVCTAAGCQSLGSVQVKEALEKGAGDCCRVKGVGCMGLCSAGPLVSVEPERTLYKNVAPADAPEILESLETGKTVERLECDACVPFFNKQHKIVLENSGRIDPERI